MDKCRKFMLDSGVKVQFYIPNWYSSKSHDDFFVKLEKCGYILYFVTECYFFNVFNYTTHSPGARNHESYILRIQIVECL